MDVRFERKHKGAAGTIEWFTPPSIVGALGGFDMDVCTDRLFIHQYAPIIFDIEDDGLAQEWKGRVWCNPPYGDEAAAWIKKLSEHGNGCTLIFARTETKMWHEHIWPKADAILFIKGRLKFMNLLCEVGGSAGAPSCIVAYGQNNVEALERSGIKGKIVYLKR
jgi:hypothetical protein